MAFRFVLTFVLVYLCAAIYWLEAFLPSAVTSRLGVEAARVQRDPLSRERLASVIRASKKLRRLGERTSPA